MGVLLCGYYGQNNGGDEALLATLLQMLPPGVTPIVLSGNPSQTRDRYGVAALPRKNPRALLQALPKARALILGGGSLMQDSTSTASLLYYGGLLAAAQSLGVPTIAWAQGIGPLNRPWSRWITRRLFRRCQGVTVRDGRSAQLLRQWGIPHQEAPDPVWALAPLDPITPLPWQMGQPAPLILNLRLHPSLTDAWLETLTQACCQFQALTGAPVGLLPFQPERDRPPLEQVAQRLPGTYHWLNYSHPQHFKAVFGGVGLTVAMRLHGLIMAAGEGSPCYALSYDPKVTALQEAVGLPGYPLGQPPPASQDLCRDWVQLYQEGQGTEPRMRQSLGHRALVHQEMLHRLLGSSRA
jgi:polysaccharide pyruvyl transferase CsaB